MLFPTGLFLFVFLPITVGMFFLLAKIWGARSASTWLVLSSLCFYGCWRPIHVLLLVASVGFNYCGGGLILRAKRDDTKIRARTLLIFFVTANLFVLAYFKYFDFFMDSVNAAGFHAPRLAIALPLGISFFTFTQIAYLVDVYSDKAFERSPLRYALFVTYFPHLVAGPILHHAQIMPQFKDPKIYVPQLRSFALGLSFLLFGLAKKVLIADSFAPIADQSFGDAARGLLAAAEAWSGVLSYTLQIYFDFSGYSDMAVGLSLLIGIRLPYNFNSPYKALNIIEFWRRWHMTLSRFLRDYLYISLGGNRKGTARRYINLLATMLLGGLWHGASWTFVVWGGLHGVYLAVNHWWVWLRARYRWSSAATKGGGFRSAIGRGMSHALTLACVVVAWVFFRANDFKSAATMLKAMIGQSSAQTMAGPPPTIALWGWLLIFLAIVLTLPNSQEVIDDRVTKRVSHMTSANAIQLTWFVIALWLVGIVMLASIYASRGVTEFIYFNF